MNGLDIWFVCYLLSLSLYAGMLRKNIIACNSEWYAENREQIDFSPLFKYAVMASFLGLIAYLVLLFTDKLYYWNHYGFVGAIGCYSPLSRRADKIASLIPRPIRRAEFKRNTLRENISLPFIAIISLALLIWISSIVSVHYFAMFNSAVHASYVTTVIFVGVVAFLFFLLPRYFWYKKADVITFGFIIVPLLLLFTAINFYRLGPVTGIELPSWFITACGYSVAILVWLRIYSEPILSAFKKE